MVSLYAAAYFLPPFSFGYGSYFFDFEPIGANTAAVASSDDVNAVVAGGYAELLGLGELTPMCGDLPELGPGDTFTCTATTLDGQVVGIAGSFDDAKGIYIEGTNVVSSSGVEEAFFVTYTNENPNDGLTLDGVDCGDGFVILDDDDQLQCAIEGWRWEPATATVRIISINPPELTWVIE